MKLSVHQTVSWVKRSHTIYKEVTDLNMDFFNNKIIKRLCFFLAFCMLCSCFFSMESKACAVSESVEPLSTEFVAGYGIDVNTQLCTAEMLGVRNVAYITTNSKRGYNEQALRESALVLCVHNYLYNVSVMYSNLHWDMAEKMHTDIFILDFIHRQDGEK